MGTSIKTLRYVYDSRGNRKALIDQDGGRFTYTYDAVNRISHILGMQTVAESVENAQVLAKITELGMDYAQGYFIAEPEAMVHAPSGKPVELEPA